MAVFTKPEGTWKLTSPVAAEAEQADLEDFINSVSRLRADEMVAESIAAVEAPVAEAEVAVEAQEAAAEPVAAAHDPYSEAEAAPAPVVEPAAAKSEFVSPLPATPISELKNAPAPVSRPPMAGRYAMAGLKPIVVAKQAGANSEPPVEKKKGLFVNRLLNRFLTKKD